MNNRLSDEAAFMWKNVYTKAEYTCRDIQYLATVLSQRPTPTELHTAHIGATSSNSLSFIEAHILLVSFGFVRWPRRRTG